MQRQIIVCLIELAKKFLPEACHSLSRQIFLKFLSPFYKGKKVKCPCCRNHFRKFVPYGSRTSEICPRCGSFSRHRLIWLYLKNKTFLFKDNIKVLHIAPEGCFQNILQSLPNIKYISADLKSPLAMLKTDVAAIACKEDYFDAILCIHVLEHTKNDRNALREIFRVLKPGGWAIIQVPIDYTRTHTYQNLKIASRKERKHIYGREDHLRIYGCDFGKFIESVGFYLKIDHYTKELTQAQIDLYGLPENKYIYLCTKPE